MKQTIIIVGTLVLGFLFLAGNSEAAARLLKATEFANVGVGKDAVIVYKLVDGTTTCYITRQGIYGAHAISCVE